MTTMTTFHVHGLDQALIDRMNRALDQASCEPIRRAIDRQVLRGGQAFDETRGVFHIVRRLTPFAELAVRHVEGIAIKHRCSSMAKKRADIAHTFALAGFPLDLDDEDDGA